VMNLINNNNEIVPKIIAPKKYDSDKRTIIIDPKEYDSANKIWIRKPPAPFKVIPSYQEVHKEFRKIVTIDYDKKTAIFDISVEHISPVFAFELLSMIINEFNQLEQNKDFYIKNEQLFLKPNEVLDRNNFSEGNYTLQFDFLKQIIRKRKRFSKWNKADKSADIEVIKEYYGYSRDKAYQVLPLLSKDKIDHLRKKISKGGRNP